MDRLPAVAQEIADVERLLDLFEEDLDAPARPVDSPDGGRGSCRGVGIERSGLDRSERDVLRRSATGGEDQMTVHLDGVLHAAHRGRMPPPLFLSKRGRSSRRKRPGGLRGKSAAHGVDYVVPSRAPAVEEGGVLDEHAACNSADSGAGGVWSQHCGSGSW